jgi:subtilisin family serine protease
MCPSIGHEKEKQMKKKFFVIALAIGASALALLIQPARSGAQGSKFRRTENAVPNQYIVVLKSDTEQSLVNSTTQSLAESYGGQVRFVYEYALKGFSVTMTEESAMALSKDELVEFVEENGSVSINTTQFGPTWGLDRIDQRLLPLSNSYTYDNRGTGVNAYIIDTGIRPTHAEFAPAGRAIAAVDYAPPEGCPECGGGCSLLRPIICEASSKPETQDVTTLNSDCHGHGTHVAGTVGGINYGVAKNVKLFGVRVLNCSGSGTYESVIAGVNWVTAHHQAFPGPAVANMSLGGAANASLDLAVNNSINSGVTYAVAAGNGNGVTGVDASTVSPARVANACTVGATAINDQRAGFSNFGSLVDIHAPGVNVTSAWNTSDTATNTISGTSMATPHVAGVAALYLQTYRTASPATVCGAIVNNSTFGVIGGMPGNTANRLLYSRFFPVAQAPRATSTDFDGDVKADLAVWRPSTGVWHILYSLSGTSSATQWGLADDKIVPGDYDGDGKADVAVWRPSTGIWYIVSSSSGAQRYDPWGTAGDIPVPADYDADGRTDLAVWRPSTGIWYIVNSSSGLERYEAWGLGSLGDKPVAADYDGDGQADLAVWRSSEGQWYIRNSSDGSTTGVQFGGSSFNDVLVPSDYDGDGKADIAVWRPGDGVWYILNSSTGAVRYESWGLSGDLPVAADYDGDGKSDVAVWRPSTGIWYIIQSSNGAARYESWGTSGDVPIPSAYNRY